MAAADYPVLSHNTASENIPEINSMDQLSVVVPTDRDLTDSIAPETLQIFSILEHTSLPDLEVFTTPKLDKTIIDQVPFSHRKSVEI